MKNSLKVLDDVGREAEKVDRNLERQLIAQAKSGDRRAVRKLIDLHKDRLFSFIWRMVRHHHDAEEVCQEAFLKAFASLDSFSTEYRFSTWLFTIGYRVCLNRLRRKKAVDAELDLASFTRTEEDSADSALESDEAGRLRETVWSAVDQLSPPQQATLVLFYRQEKGCEEIARILELPVATVKSHLHRGRMRLRDVLEGVDNQELQAYRNRVG